MKKVLYTLAAMILVSCSATDKKSYISVDELAQTIEQMQAKTALRFDGLFH